MTRHSSSNSGVGESFCFTLARLRNLKVPSFSLLDNVARAVERIQEAWKNKTLILTNIACMSNLGGLGYACRNFLKIEF